MAVLTDKEYDYLFLTLLESLRSVGVYTVVKEGPFISIVGDPQTDQPISEIVSAATTSIANALMAHNTTFDVNSHWYRICMGAGQTSSVKAIGFNDGYPRHLEHVISIHNLNLALRYGANKESL